MSSGRTTTCDALIVPSETIGDSQIETKLKLAKTCSVIVIILCKILCIAICITTVYVSSVNKPNGDQCHEYQIS